MLLALKSHMVVRCSLQWAAPGGNPSLSSLVDNTACHDFLQYTAPKLAAGTKVAIKKAQEMSLTAQ
jgi:hypothetical protein